MRHRPDSIGLVLDPAGWTDVAELVARVCAAGRPFSVDLVRRIFAENETQRFALSPDGLRIRANQGHSVEVELGLPPAAPPPRLFHGTARLHGSGAEFFLAENGVWLTAHVPPEYLVELPADSTG